MTNLLLKEFKDESRVYNVEYVDVMSQPQFFGARLNIARNDMLKYPKFDQLYQTQFSFFWNPEEIDLKQDARDWKTLSDVERRIFEKNLAYQTLLDSVQERAPSIALLPYASLPELEALCVEWPFYENIHSKSYQHMLRNVFQNPTEVFDDVINDVNIRARAEAVIAPIDEFIEYAQLWSMFGEGEITITKGNTKVSIIIDIETLYEKFYLYLVTTYFLEAIRFYICFLCTFYFAAQRNKMKGSASINTLISRDEKVHTGITLNIITNYKKFENNPIMLRVMDKNKDNVINIFNSVMEQEIDWIKYLFKDGPLLGLNEEILTQYLYYIGGNRLHNLGFANPYKSVKHPCSWVESYFNPKSKTVAPQEMENTEYLVGATSTDNFDIKNYDHIIQLNKHILINTNE